ncbi:GAF domain-containing sensor histidine kinase [Chryseolinea lacunae]|uniref:histidine kinase n=1 Tax=Chryseolinea lacunae TaxID=2801331 RepID=A0ABS1KYP0_9BACT|nr:ATP-binding protein [Chryseolinea lacunae]MBL0744566.1 GAF domain-containing protein [Chryseolinea lacunae]
METAALHKLTTQLECSQRKMDIITKVSFELSKLVSLPQKLHTILDILNDQFSLQNSMILVPDGEQRQLTVVASHGYDEDPKDKVVPFGQGIVGLSAARRKHINLTGIRRKQHYMAAVSHEGELNFLKPLGLPDAESQVAIPLVANDALVAVLMAESRSFCVFTRDDENFLITLAQPLAVSIQNSMLYDSMEEKIRERTAELQRLSETKDKFFSIISHDLRGPVTSFQSLARLFSHYHKLGQTDKIDSLCDKVDQSADNLNHLLENLLDWSLSQTNGIQCVFETITLPGFLKQIVALYQDSLLAKEITLNLSVEDDLTLQADHHTLATAIRNLVSNAIKFTPRGGVITMVAARHEQLVTLSIRDSGVGIDKQKRDALFSLRGQRTTCGTEREKGTGLGLILVKEFTELNHGRVAIESEQGHGTTFTLTFPGK